MADKTGIEWTDATWNPVTGCAKVSQGCKNCYALRDWQRLSAMPNTVYFGREFTDVRVHHDRLDQPIRWKKPRMIFVNSMSDLFHESVPDEFIDSVFAVMATAEQHTFQILTKRPERMLKYLSSLSSRSQEIAQASMYVLNRRMWVDGDGQWDYVANRVAGGPLPNVWVGVSVEDQKTADERIPLLLASPAAVRWISAEPLLGGVDLSALPNLLMVAEGQRYLDALRGFAWECSGPEDVDTCNIGTRIDWVVVGGESGPNARPMHPVWVSRLRDQCIDAGVPFLFKQWGEWVPRSACYHSLADGTCLADVDPDATRWACVRLTESGHNGLDITRSNGGDDAYMQRIGKKAAGRLLGGRTYDGYPV